MNIQPMYVHNALGIASDGSTKCTAIQECVQLTSSQSQMQCRKVFSNTTADGHEAACSCLCAAYVIQVGGMQACEQT